jgi:hypothetical protein
MVQVRLMYAEIEKRLLLGLKRGGWMTCRILLALEQRLNFSWRSNLAFLGIHTYV